jgi:predicted metal-binding protein
VAKTKIEEARDIMEAYRYFLLFLFIPESMNKHSHFEAPDLIHYF